MRREEKPFDIEPHLWKPLFLARYRDCCNIRMACDAVGIHRNAVTEARKRDPVFNRDFLEARQDAIDTLEARAREGALLGFEKPILYQGQITGTYREIDPTMIKFLLRSYRPERFGIEAAPNGRASDPELSEETETAAGTIDLSALTREQLLQLRAIVAAQQRPLPEGLVELAETDEE